MKRVLGAIAALIVVAVIAGGAVFFFSREEATVPIEQGYGPNPTLPPPNPTLIPTIHVAEANPWPKGTMPSRCQD